jgi:hypothetical protein
MSLQFHEGDNIGSILKLEAAPHYDFSGFNPVAFHFGKGWIDIPFKEESGVLQLKADDTDHGISFNYAGRFFIHKQRADVRSTLYPFLGQHLILKVTDLNGEVYIIGKPGCPVTLELSATTGQRYADENGMEFQFKIEQDSVAVTA